MKKIVTSLLISSMVLPTFFNSSLAIAETIDVTKSSELINNEDTSTTTSQLAEENDSEIQSSSSVNSETTELDSETASSTLESVVASTDETITDSSQEAEIEQKTPKTDLIQESLQNPIRQRSLTMMGEKATLSVPSHVTSFINMLSANVYKLAADNGLYGSVMMAQASLESAWGTSKLASAPNYNLFGIKYISTPGQDDNPNDYVEIMTTEVENGVEVQKSAKFRKYKSYDESLKDYVSKMLYGVSWDTGRYTGTWRKNAKTYQEATAALTNKYSTDPNYHVKLNNIIEKWGYTQFDQPLATYKITGNNMNKAMNINSLSYYVYTAPYRTVGAMRVGKLSEAYALNSAVTVEKSAETSAGTKVYYLKDIGWVDQRAVKTPAATIKKSETRNDNMLIVSPNYYLYEKPYGTHGSVKLGKLIDKIKLGSVVKVTKYAETSKGVQTYYIDGYGWVDARALRKAATFNEESNFSKKIMRIKSTNYNIYSQPYNVDGMTTVSKLSKKYKVNDKVTVTRYGTTNQGVKTYYIENIGWVDYRAFEELAVYTDNQFIPKNMRIKNNSFNIYSAPYKTENWSLISQIKAKYNNNDQVRVTRYGTTNQGVKTYYIENVGWVDYRAVKDLATFKEDNKFKAKAMRVANANYNLYKAPYLTEGWGLISPINKKYKKNDQVNVTRYGTTSDGVKTYYIENVGWVDYRSLKEVATFNKDNSFKTKNMKVKNASFNLYKAPYMTTGWGLISAVSAKYKKGDNVKVTQYGTTSDGVKTYYIENVGWVDHRALENYATIKQEQTLNKSFVVSKAGYNLYSAPYNTQGMKLISQLKAKYKVGSIVTVTKKVTTSQGVQTYYIKNVGWVDHRALNENIHAEKMKKVQSLLNRKYNSSRYGIYVESMGDHSTASINANKRYTAASTGKLPAIYYTQKQINAGKIKPTAKYLYTDAINNMNNAYMRGGAGILQSKPKNKYYSIDEILNWTIKYSDNQGTNFLAYYACGKYNATMKKEISNIIGRTWESPFSITAKENAKLMEAIYKQGGQATKYLQNTVYDNQRIPKYLPVKVGHKIGDVYDYRHDVAIVYANTPFVLSVMTSGSTSYETISIMAKEIYDILK